MGGWVRGGVQLVQGGLPLCGCRRATQPSCKLPWHRPGVHAAHCQAGAVEASSRHNSATMLNTCNHVEQPRPEALVDLAARTWDKPFSTHAPSVQEPRPSESRTHANSMKAKLRSGVTWQLMMGVLPCAQMPSAISACMTGGGAQHERETTEWREGHGMDGMDGGKERLLAARHRLPSRCCRLTVLFGGRLEVVTTSS